MKSPVVFLAILVSASAFAADNKRYWESRDVNPKRPDKHYWEKRDANPGEEDTPKRPDPKYWEKRDPAPAPEPTVTLDPSVDRDHTNDRQDLTFATDEQKQRPGIAIEAGGGLGGFIDNRISHNSTPQGQWTARVIFGTRSYFGGEAAYVGSAQGVNFAGVSSGATLTGNGAEGAFRYNMLTGMWQPYAVMGIGWNHYSLGGATITTADVQPTGDVATFPMGVGMAWRMNGIVLDHRISFHPATNSAVLAGANMSTWDINLRAGFEI